MNFKTFIETKYDVRDRIAQLQSNPIKDFIASDIFPCDYVDIENGEMVKMLYFAGGGREIAVLDLLSYRREDLVKLGDADLLSLFDTYVSDLEFDGSNLLDMAKLATIREDSVLRNSQKRDGGTV